jgi:uncharacterized protein
VRLLLISDTHARPLPTVLWEAVDALRAEDVLVHAGDWVSEDLLDDLETFPPRIVACWGNNDGPELRDRLPEVARVVLDGVRLSVTHETGGAQGREARADRAHPDTDVLVFGHSHIPWDSTSPRGMRLLNPGSPTDRRRQPTFTWMTATIADGSLGDVELHHLDPA